MGLLTGKTAIVTGAARGIGKAVAMKFASEGANIAFTDLVLNDEMAAGLEATRKEIEALGVTCRAYAGNAADFEETDKTVKQIHADFGSIDILVNNAGIIKRCDAIDVTPENWDAVDFLNEKMVFFLSQAVAKQWVADKKGGKIINIASMLSFQGGIRVPAYTSSKSAVMGMTKALANEWAKYGINVNAIAPGYMATNNTNQLRQDEERSEEILARIPAGRWGTPADVGGAAIFLASAAAAYVNGYTLAVDGGWLAR